MSALILPEEAERALGRRSFMALGLGAAFAAAFGIKAAPKLFKVQPISYGFKIGDTVRFRLPQVFEVTSGDALRPFVLQDRYEDRVLLTKADVDLWNRRMYPEVFA